MKRGYRESNKAVVTKKKKPSSDLRDHETDNDEESGRGVNKRSSERNISGSLFSKKTRSFLRGEDDYLPGNIIKVELKNFMTYDYLEALPGSRLNLIIGPNGTGKSSLVCAICIVLGGDPKLLGRAVNVGEYVQRGFESSIIKITLRGETQGKNYEITRKISATSKTEWLLNSLSCRKEDIKSLIQKFNIQVDNLTQFLPQDKVCEFAKLSSVDLLRETEKAVGDPELHSQHEYLVTKKDEVFRLQTAVEQTGRALDGLKAENEELEKDVERMAERDTILAKVELMRKKLPWLHYDRAKRDYLAVKEKVKEAKKLQSDLTAQHKAVEAPLRKARNRKEAMSSQVQRLRDSVEEKTAERRKLLKEEEELSLRVQSKSTEREQLLRHAESHKQKLQRAEEAFQQAKLDIEQFQVAEVDVSTMEGIDEQVFQLDQEAEGLSRQMKDKRRALDEMGRHLSAIRQKLKEAESWQGRIVQALVNSGEKHLQESLEWLNQNRSRFKGPVFGPVAVEINIPDPEHAKYLEQLVPHWVWKAFVVTCEADRDFLMSNMKADVINCGSASSPPPPGDLSEEVKALGITHRMDQIFQTNPTVFSVLRAQAGLHRSYIGTEAAENNSQAINRVGIMDLWTPSSHYRWTKSSYHSDVVATSNPVRPCKIFAGGSREDIIKLQKEGSQLDIEGKRVQGHLQEMEGQRSELNAKSRSLETERENLRRRNLEDTRKKRDMEARARKCRDIVESLQRAEDPSKVDKKLHEEVLNLNAQRHSLIVESTRVLIESAKDQMALAPFQLSVLEFESMLESMEDEVKESEQQLKRAEKDFSELEAQRVVLQDRLREALEAGNRTVNLREHPEVEEQFAELPGTIEELKDEMESLETEANAIVCQNPDVMVQYERRKKQIQDLEVRLENQRSELEKVQVEIEDVKGKWLPRLQDLVTRINETFGRNFAEMAVAGEVRLDERGLEFDKYGIQILVKFREKGELQPLSATHQSGGERSVSTILYLVSLQAITHCPFRVVDEINQGMDLQNERKMFQQLVRAASLPNTPQCFLLTPKLLPDLDYGTSCSVLNIMNGPYISDALEAGFQGGGSLAAVLHQMTSA